MKVVLPKKGFWGFWFGPVGKVLLALMLVGGVTGAAVFSFYWNRYARLIDRKLSQGPFTTPSKIFAAPEPVYVGQPATPADIVSRLRGAGYSELSSNRNGWYRLRSDAVEIFPGSDSYFASEPAVVKFTATRAGNKVSRIVSLRDNTDQAIYELEPELITNLFDKNRDKRRLVRFDEIPKVLLNAIVAIEDKRFFEHSGFDTLRVIKAAYIDAREMKKDQGSSTISQQLARMFFLTPRKSWSRKAAELVIALQLEQRLTKQQIFEFYANQVPMGRRGSFNIQGVGEAAQAYFGKDFRELTLPEAATLAGLIQRPSYLNPFRNPERARERRNVVLKAMLDNNYITQQQYNAAIQAPLNVVSGAAESSDAPYFVDMVNEQIQGPIPEKDLLTHVYRVYTTLDLNLQRAAVDAVRYGMPLVDEQIRRQRRWRGKTPPTAQCVLIALDPHSGEVRALLGGRNYGTSQLNRAVAKRQPGSSFKPFVYAAALNTALDASGPVLTPITAVDDEPTTFWFDGKPYEPSNFKHEFHGMTDLRTALAHSMNVATIKIAEMVGYDKVVALAKAAGMNDDIQATPAVAIGSYDVEPIEIAGAYTIFANDGVRETPYMIRSVRDQYGRVVFENHPIEQRVLDPRIAYMMTNLLEEVMRSGTAAGVRARGFTAPAAGKTGTSRDAWFAGYTSNLLCIVWVGFDDNTNLESEGAKLALPIWTEFMKKAMTFRAYRNPAPFEPVDGIVTAEVDPQTQELATVNCPDRRMEVFIAGTQPAAYCRVHGGRPGATPLLTTVAGWDTDSPPDKTPPTSAVVADAKPAPTAALPTQRPRVATRSVPIPPEPSSSPSDQSGQKKGLFRRLWDALK